jgi:hypothetical protein
LQQQSAEIGKQSQQLGQREATLKEQQTQLHAALAELENHKTEVMTAREMASQIQGDREEELRAAREEIAALKAQVATGDPHVADRLAAVERREQEVLVLMEEIEAARVGGDGAARAAVGHRLHGAVAEFWAGFDASKAASGGGTTDLMGAHGLSEHLAMDPSSPAKSAAVEPCESVNFVDGEATQASAMRSARKAAKAEIEEADQARAPSLRNKKPSKQEKEHASPPSTSKKTPAAAVAAVAMKKAAQQTAASDGSASVNLDAETAAKLKLLRRLNPGKSEQELLSQIANDQDADGGAKPKSRRRWFSRG